MSKVKVMFRKDKDDEILAIFPEIPSHTHLSNCCCFDIYSGHGSCTIDTLIAITKPAKAEEYQPTLTVLVKNYEYDLIIVKRYSRKMFENRKLEFNREIT